MVINNEITLDISKQTQFVKISLPQGDAIDRVFKINLINGVDEYIIPATATVRFEMTRPNGSFIYNNCPVENNQAILEITPAISAVDGRFPAQFRITDSSTGGLIKSFRFHILIHESVDIENAVVNTSEFTALQDMELRVGDITPAIQAAETATDNANNAADQLEVETLIIWKPYVSTYVNIATTYPIPELGWTTQAQDTGIRWRYNGTEWINIGVVSDDKVGDLSTVTTTNKINVVGAINELDSQLAEIENQKYITEKAKIVDVNAALDKKATRGEITSADLKKLNESDRLGLDNLREEVIQAIVGNTPVNSIPADGSVTPIKTSFLRLGKNLFNKDEAISGKYLNSNTGLPTIDNPSYFSSDFIKVLPNTDYYINGTEVVIGYNAEKGFVSALSSSLPIVSIPGNVFYIRFSALNTNLNTIQVELGNKGTTYEPYKFTFDTTLIPPASIDKEQIKGLSVSPKEIDGYIQGKNLFNKHTAIQGYFVGGATGNLGENADYAASDFIEAMPSTTYTLKHPQYSAFYDTNKVFISGFTEVGSPTFISPSNAAYFRTSATLSQLDTQQLEIGNKTTAYEPYQYSLKYLSPKNIQLPSSKRDKLYSFKDAWIAWENGEKFPVGILGDSTCEGANTSTYNDANRHEVQDQASGGWGMVDYINTKAFPYVLEQLIKEETGKAEPRIYNMSYTGKSLLSLKGVLGDILGNAYADTKMVGIALGINDRVQFNYTKEYEAHMTTYLDYYINFIYDKGMQPFIITSQATLEPYKSDNLGYSYPLRTSEHVNSVANRVKHEMANKYNLEIIELTDFGEHVMNYSSYPLNAIISDRLHFNDKGNELEAGYLFSQFNPRTIVVMDKNEKLTFASQRIKSNIPDNKITFLTLFEDGFKVKADYAKEDTSDILMQDFYVLNYSKEQLGLYAYMTSPGSQYVKLNGTEINLTENGQLLDSLDIGLHHIQAFTGESTKVDFKGFTLN